MNLFVLGVYVGTYIGIGLMCIMQINRRDKR